jgi:hypothetical protein
VDHVIFRYEDTAVVSWHSFRRNCMCVPKTRVFDKNDGQKLIVKKPILVYFLYLISTWNSTTTTSDVHARCHKMTLALGWTTSAGSGPVEDVLIDECRLE